MRFEKITDHAFLPERATAHSAGYDFKASESVIIPAHGIALVPTGIKCKMEPNQCLLLLVRSSMPRKMGLTLANNVGLVDADYYGNPGNDGHIMFQLMNITDKEVQINYGDKIGQGIVTNFYTAEDDAATGERLGGFGSTSLKNAAEVIFGTSDIFGMNS